VGPAAAASAGEDERLTRKRIAIRTMHEEIAAAARR
jgi:hypothetical protein